MKIVSLRAAAAAAAVAASLLSACACALPSAAAPAPAAKGAPPVIMAPPPSAMPPPTFTPSPIVAVDAPNNKLHLTVAQQTKANTIMQGFFQKRVALIGNKNQTQAQMQSAYSALAKSTHAQMLAVLTPDQKKALAGFQAQQKHYLTGARQAGAKMMQARQQLQTTITPAEKAKIASLQQGMLTQERALATDQKMTIAQKTQQAASLRSGLEAKIKAILTPTQQTIFSTMTRYAEEYDSLMSLARKSGV